jgi:ADP-heptose:LPS heptosyltransferase
LLVELSKCYRVIIVGLDISISDEFRPLESDKIINLIGKTNLVEVMEIISSSEGVISNDSGLMHVSASLGQKNNSPVWFILLQLILLH